jgi:F-type H+-transporting ATPase subunit delta
MTGAGEYGRALFLLCEEEKSTERVLDELDALSELLKQNPTYTKLLDTPAVVKDERLALIDEAFSAFDENLKNLIKILAEARCTHLLPAVRESFDAEYCEARGILHAEAITAVPLTEAETKKLIAKLMAKTGKKVILKNKIDKATLGGVILRYGWVQLDGSVKTRLDKFEEALTETVI